MQQWRVRTPRGSVQGPYGGVRIRRVSSYVLHVRRDGQYVTLTLGPSPGVRNGRNHTLAGSSHQPSHQCGVGLLGVPRPANQPPSPPAGLPRGNGNRIWCGSPRGGMGTTHTCRTHPPFGADCWETPLLGRYVLPGGPYRGVRIRRVGSYVPHVRRDGYGGGHPYGTERTATTYASLGVGEISRYSYWHCMPSNAKRLFARTASQCLTGCLQCSAADNLYAQPCALDSFSTGTVCIPKQCGSIKNINLSLNELS